METIVPIALAIHGGAWNIPDASVERHRRGIERALTLAWDALSRGASALDVVELAVRALEDDPTFNAGRGSHLNAGGRLEMDASIMEGTGLRAGAVAAIAGVRHPVSVARRVLEDSPHVLLVAQGARAFARAACPTELCRTDALLVGHELARWRKIRRGDRSLVSKEFHPSGLPEDHYGTVGAAALDRRGRIAAATSTGGTQHKAPGRVGDSPIIGAGTYADDRAGAVSCTGWGEGILRAVLAKGAVDALSAGRTPAQAGRAALGRLRRVGGHAGLVLVDRAGRAAAAFDTPRMARGLATERSRHVLVESAVRRR
jgi:beta-aspartyl-peptidase (threonine type)